MHKIEVRYKEKGYKSIYEIRQEYLKRTKPLIEKKLKSYKPRNRSRKLFVSRLLLNLNDILIGKPLVLQKVIENFRASRLLGLLSDSSFNKRILDIFGYDGLRKSHSKGVWLGEVLGIRACVYCNSQFTLSLTKGKKLMYTFDHFFPKSKYPFLSSSLYNLIPSCAYCNQRKSDNDYSINDFVNPHIESFDELAVFKTTPSSIINFISGNYKDSNLIEVNLVRASPNKVRNGKVKLSNQLKQFDLDEVYVNHKDVVGELYIKAKIYNSTFRRYLMSFTSKKLFLSDEHLNRLIVGNYVLKSDINMRPLTKLYQDISYEAGLIK